MNQIEDKKILIVDDTSVNRLLIKTILRSFGFTSVDEACNGKEAIRRVECSEYSMIFMDIQMSVMDGIQATRIIRNSLMSTTPIIAITAFGDIEIEKNGFNDLIRKPYGVDKIKNSFMRFMKHPL